MRATSLSSHSAVEAIIEFAEVAFAIAEAIIEVAEPVIEFAAAFAIAEIATRNLDKIR